MASTAQLLLLSPDSTLLQAAERCVLAIGHSPFLARTLAEARRTVARLHIDLICLDSALPNEETESFWRWLAANQNDATPPVIILAPPSRALIPSALPSFFQPHRDVLVAKPLDSTALAREVVRLLAAAPGRERPAELVQVGSVALDGSTRQLLFAGGGGLSLTPTEFRLLRCLMERPGEFVSLEELLEHVWGYPPGTGGPEVVRAHISNLRKKLRTSGQDCQLVRTIPYQGYGFVPSETVGSPA